MATQKSRGRLTPGHKGPSKKLHSDWERPRASIVDMERGAINALRDIGVQILVLDEIHNILAGSSREQRIVLNTLHFLSNELRLSLICFGIMEPRDAINSDVQLA